MTKAPEIKCPKCANKQHFQSKGNRHFCRTCAKFFITREETKGDFINRTMRSPVSTR